MNSIGLQGLASVIHPAPDLDAAKTAFTALLGVEPYFDATYYVGYRVGAFEIGLDPDADPDAGAVAYWRVGDADGAAARLLDAGGTLVDPVHDVGGGIRMASVDLPCRAGRIGVLEQPEG